MQLTVDDSFTNAQALFVYRKKSLFVEKLCLALKKHGIDVFTSSKLPTRVSHFTYLFICATEETITYLDDTPSLPKTLCIIESEKINLNKIARYFEKNNLKNCKAIHVHPNENSDERINTALWFFFSKSDEKVLNLYLKQSEKIHHYAPTPTTFFTSPRKRTIIFTLFLLIISLQIFFLIPLAASGIGLYKTVRLMRSENFEKAELMFDTTSFFVTLANNSYKLARPLYSLFFLALPIDDIFVVTNNSHLLLQTTFEAQKNTESFITLFFTTPKTDLQLKEATTRFSLIQKQSIRARDAVSLIISKTEYLPIKPPKDIVESLVASKKTLDHTISLLPRIESLLEKENGEYLIFFANNMELRPGGGFIGSYATMSIGNYTLKTIDVEDVYEADGQLVEHIDPPEPIRRYLNQPNWFLRDSFFSPDFKKNFKQAEFFLEKEIGKKTYEGGALITTTAITYLLEVFGDVYIPDYHQTITKDNFYIKTQLQVEQDFFPGSKQKKNFLSSLVVVLSEKIKTAPKNKLSHALIRALEEKHLIFYFVDPLLQEHVDRLGFGGGLIEPICAQNLTLDKDQTCIADYLYPVDANLGVNKANFYIKRQIQLDVDFTQSETVNHTYTQTFTNNSPATLFPGGTYKNYFQLHIPKKAVITSVAVENTPTDIFDQSTTAKYKTIGLYIEIPPKSQKKVTLTYATPASPLQKNTTYQLVTQKQIGTVAADFIIRLHIPQNTAVSAQNFTALAKDSQLLYNTTLSSDKIFLVAFSTK